jgi:hypothetical protein
MIVMKWAREHAVTLGPLPTALEPDTFHVGRIRPPTMPVACNNDEAPRRRESGC